MRYKKISKKINKANISNRINKTNKKTENAVRDRRKKAVLSLMSTTGYSPMKIKGLAVMLGVEKERRNELQKVLDILLSEGKIAFNKKGEYKKSSGKASSEKRVREKRYIEGIFMESRSGFGFVRTEKSGKNDIFIPENDICGAMDGDKVEVLLKKSRGGMHQSGKITGIIKRARTHFAGELVISKKRTYVVPFNDKTGRKLIVRGDNTGRALAGDIVSALITDYDARDGYLRGEITEILGHAGDKSARILSILADKDIPLAFPDEVMEEAHMIPQKVNAGSDKTRRDLRNLLCVTIDGLDAKDLDDAVSLEKKRTGYRLGVHIADVSAYVRVGSALDIEANKRGNSVYLPGKVVPMLPKELSNGICSLNEKVNRYALSVFMDFDSKGHMKNSEVYRSIIRVSKRMDYDSVNEILEKDIVPKGYKKYVSVLKAMNNLAEKIKAVRDEKGAISFDFPEAKILLDEEGNVVDIKLREDNSATRLIENFMISANEAVAGKFKKTKAPFIYRIHERPDAEKVEATISMFRKNGFKVGKSGRYMTSGEIQRALSLIAGSDKEAMLSRLMLRSMSQARYSISNEGHFALASEDYCHFTSPIRRYPDLCVHRMIKKYLIDDPKFANCEFKAANMEETAEHCSFTERNAVDAERAAIKIKKAEYMKAHIGEHFDGIISGVTGRGFFVELANTVEGFVRTADLRDDRYEFSERESAIIGRRHGKRYTLGDPVRVAVINVDTTEGTIDFDICKADSK